jgi:hypothetical protein
MGVEVFFKKNLNSNKQDVHDKSCKGRVPLPLRMWFFYRTKFFVLHVSNVRQTSRWSTKTFDDLRFEIIFMVHCDFKIMTVCITMAIHTLMLIILHCSSTLA